MKDCNVKTGMKVVPHSKSVWSNQKCIDSNNWRTAQAEGQPFLYVLYYEEKENAWVLSSKKRTRGGDFFLASDFEPYDPVAEVQEQKSAINPASSKYNREILGLDGRKALVDVYRVLVAFDITDPELQHALKKLLCLGIRGKGDYRQDLNEAVLSLNKLQERKEQER